MSTSILRTVKACRDCWPSRDDADERNGIRLGFGKRRQSTPEALASPGSSKTEIWRQFFSRPILLKVLTNR